MSPLQQITYRLLIQPSHLIEDTAWLLSIRIKWSRLRPVYRFIHFNIFLGPAIPIKMQGILQQLGRGNRHYIDGVGILKRIRRKKSPRLHASVESVDFRLASPICDKAA